MREEMIAAVLVLAVIGCIMGASVYQSMKKPECTYTYDLQAKIIKSTCPISDAGLYAKVLVKDKGILVPEAERVADLKLMLISSTQHEYIYKFEIVGSYPPGAWVMVDFEH